MTAKPAQQCALCARGSGSQCSRAPPAGGRQRAPESRAHGAGVAGAPGPGARGQHLVRVRVRTGPAWTEFSAGAVGMPLPRAQVSQGSATMSESCLRPHRRFWRHSVVSSRNTEDRPTLGPQRHPRPGSTHRPLSSPSCFVTRPHRVPRSSSPPRVLTHLTRGPAARPSSDCHGHTAPLRSYSMARTEQSDRARTAHSKSGSMSRSNRVLEVIQCSRGHTTCPRSRSTAWTAELKLPPSVLRRPTLLCVFQGDTMSSHPIAQGVG